MDKSPAEQYRDLANELDKIFESDLSECECGNEKGSCDCGGDCGCGCNNVSESEEMEEAEKAVDEGEELEEASEEMEEAVSEELREYSGMKQITLYKEDINNPMHPNLWNGILEDLGVDTHTMVAGRSHDNEIDSVTLSVSGVSVD